MKWVTTCLVINWITTMEVKSNKCVIYCKYGHCFYNRICSETKILMVLLSLLNINLKCSSNVNYWSSIVPKRIWDDVWDVFLLLNNDSELCLGLRNLGLKVLKLILYFVLKKLLINLHGKRCLHQKTQKTRKWYLRRILRLSITTQLHR